MMRIKFQSVGDFEASLKWLNEASTKAPENAIRDIASAGTSALRSATPIGETGETANGWEPLIEKTQKGVDISFINTAHPESSVNVAKLIETGHATGNGGYVPPRPYIRQAMDSVFESGTDKITKEMIE